MRVTLWPSWPLCSRLALQRSISLQPLETIAMVTLSSPLWTTGGGSPVVNLSVGDGVSDEPHDAHVLHNIYLFMFVYYEKYVFCFSVCGDARKKIKCLLIYYYYLRRGGIKKYINQCIYIRWCTRCSCYCIHTASNAFFKLFIYLHLLIILFVCLNLNCFKSCDP